METSFGGDAFRPFAIEPDVLAAKFDKEPFGFSHALSGLEMWRDDALHSLAERYDAHPRDYFVAASAPAPDSVFFSVPRQACKPSEAMQRLAHDSIRILFKRPELHDPRFRELLDASFAQVMALRGGLRGERLVRLESSVFITSAASTTPFHFDPEIAFFTQIEGEKTYHVYRPEALQEADLEKFYLQGLVSIGQVDLGRCDPRLEHVYHLRPGAGFHQPQNSPHWVETRATRSVSYAFVFETDASRARGRARAGNYYLRKMGLDPVPPGRRPSLDAVKAGTMRMLIPMRQQLAQALRGRRGRQNA